MPREPDGVAAQPVAGRSGRRRVAITIDFEHPDRPHCPPDAPAAILDALASAGARATCFLQGRWVEAYPALATRIVRDGHRLGNHSFFHASLPLLSEAGLADDIQLAEQAIRELAGADPQPWFRCPFGDGWDVPWIRRVIDEAGYRQVGWDVDVRDWEGADGPDIAASILEGVAGREDAVVLLHGWPAGTPEGLEVAIRALLGAGAALVTLDELEAARLPEGWPDDQAVVP